METRASRPGIISQCREGTPRQPRASMEAERTEQSPEDGGDDVHVARVRQGSRISRANREARVDQAEARGGGEEAARKRHLRGPGRPYGHRARQAQSRHLQSQAADPLLEQGPRVTGLVGGTWGPEETTGTKRLTELQALPMRDTSVSPLRLARVRRFLLNSPSALQTDRN